MQGKLHAAALLAVCSCALAWLTNGCAPMPSDDCGSQHNCPLDAGGLEAAARSDAADAAGDAAMAEEGAPDVSSRNEAAACDAAKAPHDDPCVIDEKYGIFVSPLGADANAGTRAAPVLTIGHAMDLAKAAAKRVYICAGTFAEQLVVGVSRDGVNVFGGLDCGTWTYSTANRVTVAPTQTGYALKLDGLAQGATFEDVEFDAQRASLANAGESSIAVLASGSQNVAFVRVVITAGNATNGAAALGTNPDAGASPASNWYGTAPAYAELNGSDATDGGAGGQKICICTDGTRSTGGQGGTAPAIGGQVPGPGSRSYGSDAGSGAAGRNAAPCGGGGSPVQNGIDAPSPTADTPSSSLVALTASGFSPALGRVGSNGEPGQGGAGGGSGTSTSGAGGGGACGGCGGAGGNPGAGGGSSIALLSYMSTVSLVGCTLSASNAGAGETGGNGEGGQPGSQMAGNGRGGGCPGAGGGSGSGGNGGQGGPGGLSLGIGYVGTAPSFDGAPVAPGQSLARVTVGASGAGGGKGSAGSAAATNVGAPQPGMDGAPGATGVAQAVLNL